MPEIVHEDSSRNSDGSQLKFRIVKRSETAFAVEILDGMDAMGVERWMEPPSFKNNSFIMIVINSIMKDGD